MLSQKLWASVLALVVLTPLAGWAGGSDAIFGASGNPRCGLGTMIFGKNESISSQSSEVSSNGIFMNEMFSITTGTSGCSHSGIVQVPQTELIYAEANFEELSVELAKGQGETLTGLAQPMGCSDQDMPLFFETGKSNYQQIYMHDKIQPEQMLINLRTRLQTVPQLVKSCSSLQS